MPSAPSATGVCVVYAGAVTKGHACSVKHIVRGRLPNRATKVTAYFGIRLIGYLKTSKGLKFTPYICDGIDSRKIKHMLHGEYQAEKGQKLCPVRSDCVIRRAPVSFSIKRHLMRRPPSRPRRPDGDRDGAVNNSAPPPQDAHPLGDRRNVVGTAQCVSDRARRLDPSGRFCVQTVRERREQTGDATLYSQLESTIEQGERPFEDYTMVELFVMCARSFDPMRLRR